MGKVKLQTSSTQVCETCGSRLDLEAPSGFCAGCLLEMALQAEGDTGELGTQIGDFEVLEEIARGGMGIVYRARQRVPSRLVALKMILPAHINSADALTRFRAEAQAAASLDHEGILPIYAVGEKDGAPFYSMKFAEGGSLSACVGEFQSKPGEAAKLIVMLARAVEYAHQHGILHRDLKPGNVLFDGAGKAFVSDFGLAKWLQREADLTQTLAILGTPYYMAPEQAAGSQSLTRAADIYSLGAILFHLLTGQPPFAGENAMEVLRNAAERPPPRPRTLNRRVPPDLETICLKCLEKTPAARYGSSVALADDLERYLAGRAIHARRAGPAKHFIRWTKRNPVIAALTVASVCLFVVLVFVTHRRAPSAGEKMPGVAVLPFQDLSEDKANAYFASGIQDDVLVDLSKISGLKVISRDSVMQYRGVGRDLREIGRALGVNAVLEGNVRREGNRARINVQLIKAADGTQLWAENYERNIGDASAIEREVATQIGSVLKAKLSTADAARLREAPTTNTEAYLRYVEAKNLYQDYRKVQPDLEKAERLYQEAIALDPTFALAYGRLSQLENVYFEMYDRTPARREKARAAAREALRLQPDLPEAHVALGQDYWRANAGTGEIDYEKALAEFAIAQRGLPNDADIYESIGRIQRHQGKWAESTVNLKKAVLLDPNSVERWHRLFYNYELTRNYPAAAAALEHAIALAPPAPRWSYECHRAFLQMLWKGDLTATEQLPAPPQDDWDSNLEDWAGTKAFLRQYDEAERLLLTYPRENLSDGFSKTLFLGRICLAANQPEKAHQFFEAARVALERTTANRPLYAAAHASLAKAYAGLGQKDDAIREARRATEIIPESKDQWLGLNALNDLAYVYVLLGDFDAAIPLLEHSLNSPSGLSAQELRFDFPWDQLRKDPRFQKLLARPDVVTSVDTKMPLDPVR
jgi:serine/threonine-protein kinase